MKLNLTPVLLMTLITVSFGGAALAAPSSGSKPLHWSDGSGMEAGLIGSAEGQYDSNLQSYSEDDRELYEAGRLTTTRFKEVESMDDWSQNYAIGAYVEKSFAERRPTRVEFRTGVHMYAENDNKDYQVYSVEVKQNVTPQNDILKFRYDRLPNYFNRYLFDEDTSTYSKSEFEKDRFSFSYWKKLNRMIRVRALYALEDNDYADAFNERDNLTHNAGVKVIFDDVLPNLKVAPSYTYSTLNAEAADADVTVDDDISYDQHEIGVLLNYEFIPKWHVVPSFEYAFREYTTGNTVAVDPLHSGREDDIFTAGAGLEYDITPDITLGLRYAYTESNVTTELNPSLTTRDDVLGYKNHATSFGVEFDF